MKKILIILALVGLSVLIFIQESRNWMKIKKERDVILMTDKRSYPKNAEITVTVRNASDKKYCVTENETECTGASILKITNGKESKTLNSCFYVTGRQYIDSSLPYPIKTLEPMSEINFTINATRYRTLPTHDIPGEALRGVFQPYEPGAYRARLYYAPAPATGCPRKSAAGFAPQETNPEKSPTPPPTAFIDFQINE